MRLRRSLKVMFKIGAFSQFSRVSVKMLRHYDRLGLLPPAYVDPSTNYRYYAANQLPRLQRILALKDLGFSLEEIRHVLDGDLSGEQIRGMLKLRRAEILARQREDEARLARIEGRLAYLDQAEQMPPYDVVLRAIPAQRVASIRGRVGPQPPTVTDLFEELEAYVASHGARAPRPPLMLRHDDEHRDDRQDVEVLIPVDRPLPPSGHIRVRQLSAEPNMACTVHTGHYDTLDRAFAALLNWIERNDYLISGPAREAYLRFGADQEGYALPAVYLATSAAEFVTELQIPVAKT